MQHGAEDGQSQLRVGAGSAECAQQLARVSSNSCALLLLLRRAQVDGPHTESKRAHRSWQDERGAKALHRIFRASTTEYFRAKRAMAQCRDQQFTMLATKVANMHTFDWLCARRGSNPCHAARGLSAPCT